MRTHAWHHLFAWGFLWFIILHVYIVILDSRQYRNGLIGSMIHGNKFRKVNGEYIAQLNPNGTPGNQFSQGAWGLMPSNKAVVFLQNHDTQHQCGIGYRDGDVFLLAKYFCFYDTGNRLKFPFSASQSFTICISGSASGTVTAHFRNAAVAVVKFPAKISLL